MENSIYNEHIDKEERLNFLFAKIEVLEKQEVDQLVAAQLAKYCFGVCHIMNEVQLEERKEGTFVQGESAAQALAIRYSNKSDYYLGLNR